MATVLNRVVFMISDGTGITVQSFGKSLLTQFANLNVSIQNMSYIDTVEKAIMVAQKINQCFEETQVKPLVFITLVNPAISAAVKQAQGCFFDLFNVFIQQLEDELGQAASDTIGRAYAVADNQTYEQRIAARTDDSTQTKNWCHYSSWRKRRRSNLPATAKRLL